MHEVESIDKYTIARRGTAFTVHSPVTCFRSTEAFIEALGSKHIKIDGTVHEVKGVEMFMPGTPLRVGEMIGILVGDHGLKN